LRGRLEGDAIRNQSPPSPPLVLILFQGRRYTVFLPIAGTKTVISGLDRFDPKPEKKIGRNSSFKIV
jgi:hypothetical protein